MTLGDMINRITRTLPQASSSNISQQSIIFELNHACDEINILTGCFKKTVSYTVPSSTAPAEFSLSTICPGYLGIDDTGVWFFTSSGTSIYLYAKTKRWLDLHLRNWRDNAGAAVPTWVYLRQDALGFYPFVNVSGTSITLDALVKASPMTNTLNYPWNNSTSEVTTLRPFDNAICSYALWKLSPAVFDKEGRNSYEQEFMADLQRARLRVNARPDMTSDSDYYIRPDIQSGFLPR